MSSDKIKAEKTKLHPRNRNRERYDLPALIKAIPELAPLVKPNRFGVESVDFSNPVAVKRLNQGLLKHYYGIEHWTFPAENLCPPIPGRADYIHYVADLLGDSNGGKIPTGDQITCLDIGVGVSCIYPIIGVTEYKWQFLGSEIDPKSLASARKIVEANSSLKGKIDCRLQKNHNAMFQGIIDKDEKIDLAICNPPFHASAEEALKSSRRKIRNLSGKKGAKAEPTLNFGGISNELIYKGGESKFIKNMIKESGRFADRCFWFSTLVSKETNLRGIYKALDNQAVNEVKTIPMNTGNKTTRIVAWTFLSDAEQQEWRETRWDN
ncbi:MAG: 23S rRNA (adenine(1618)-N(6))-methyltransferase RlmF [Bacteroidia bacterium]